MHNSKREIKAVELADISKMSDEEIDTYANGIWDKFAKDHAQDPGEN